MQSGDEAFIHKHCFVPRNDAQCVSNFTKQLCNFTNHQS